MVQKRLLIAGNWKMFGRRADLVELDSMAAAASGAPAGITVVACPPSVLTAAAAARAAGSRLQIGVQSIHAGADGAHTGDINAAMAADAGAQWAIVGHSERRAAYGESDAEIAAKAAAARAAGLMPIICVGESLAERQAGQAGDVVARQIASSVPSADVVVAYEPIWAIGSGLTPTASEIAAIHAAARAAFAARFGDQAAAALPILYGGSVKPANAGAIFAIDGVDGALVGGASLKASDFNAIIAAGAGL